MSSRLVEIVSNNTEDDLCANALARWRYQAYVSIGKSWLIPYALTFFLVVLFLFDCLFVWKAQRARMRVGCASAHAHCIHQAIVYEHFKVLARHLH